MKKTLKIFLYSTLSIALLAILISYFSYSTYTAKDPDVAVDSSVVSYYHETYNDCRKAFVRGVEDIMVNFESVKTGRIMVPSEVDEDLSIDWCYIPGQKEKKKLLILTSGLHGIEGYTGSAIQIMFIEKILKKQLRIPEDMGILIFHGLNPYGFKFHRKVTENNIDLNRNCIPGGQQFDIRNGGYAELTDMLMPAEPVNINNLHNRFFYLTAISKIIKESMPVLRQAALQGQYDFKGGIYYGGKGYEPQIDTLKTLLIDLIEGYKVVLNVDLHTGYGQRGEMHLFIDKPEDKAVLTGIEKVFNGSKIDWGSSSDFYTITGDYTNWVGSLVPDVLCIPMLFEFGTMNTGQTFGSLKSMQIMILENQGAHYGYKNNTNETRTKYLFDEMYFPSSLRWRSKVISDSYETMMRMMKNYEGSEF